MSCEPMKTNTWRHMRRTAAQRKVLAFRWKDYAHGGRPGLMRLAAIEFLRRFLLHVLPSGFMKIRHYGFLANRVRTAKLDLVGCARGRDRMGRTSASRRRVLRRPTPATAPPASGADRGQWQAQPKRSRDRRCRGHASHRTRLW